MQHLRRTILLTRATGFVVLLMLASTPVFAAQDVADAQASGGDGQSIHAIWLSQNVTFNYRSDRTAYTCESFKEKVRAVLVAVGVHDSLIVELRCDSATLPPQSTGRRPVPSIFKGEVESTPIGPTHISGTSSRISTRIALAAPTVASARSIRAATTFDPQQQLLAKMRNEDLPTPSTIPIFLADWSSILLSGKTHSWLEAEDCELLRQLSQQVFPTIGIRVTRKVVCAGAKISRPTLRVEALVPLSNALSKGP